MCLVSWLEIREEPPCASQPVRTSNRKGDKPSREEQADDHHGSIFLNEKNLSFHLGGHVNHSIWWKNLSPNGVDKPTGELAGTNVRGSFRSVHGQRPRAAGFRLGRTRLHTLVSVC